MAIFDAVQRKHVLQAVAEHDAIGVQAFRERYGFGAAREYILWIEQRAYDSKAVLGVALKCATGRAAMATEFSGGRDGAARVLRDLGFEVTGGEEPRGGEWRETSDVGLPAARASWFEAARDVLLEIARDYRATVTYTELKAATMQRTGIRTNQLTQHWIGDVLGPIVDDCFRRGEPNLSSLCVDSKGSVGPGYAVAVTRNGGVVVGDTDDHAAEERLRCYRFFGAPNLPIGGGSAALVPRLLASRERIRRTARSVERVPTVCPGCFMAIPATGRCDNCD